jgi:hypothetical protein
LLCALKKRFRIIDVEIMAAAEHMVGNQTCKASTLLHLIRERDRTGMPSAVATAAPSSLNAECLIGNNLPA